MMQVGKIVDPRPWLLARHAAELADLEGRFRDARNDDERQAIAAAIKKAKKTHKRELARHARIPW